MVLHSLSVNGLKIVVNICIMNMNRIAMTEEERRVHQSRMSRGPTFTKFREAVSMKTAIDGSN